MNGNAIGLHSDIGLANPRDSAYNSVVLPAHMPAWLAYPILPAFAVCSVGMPFAKRRKIVWLASYAAFALIVLHIDFDSLGPTGPKLYVAYTILGLASFGALIVRDLGRIGGLLSMNANDWQKEFEEARRLMKPVVKDSRSVKPTDRDAD